MNVYNILSIITLADCKRDIGMVHTCRLLIIISVRIQVLDKKTTINSG